MCTQRARILTLTDLISRRDHLFASKGRGFREGEMSTYTSNSTKQPRAVGERRALRVSRRKRLSLRTPTRSPGALNPEINVVTQCRISVPSHPIPYTVSLRLKPLDNVPSDYVLGIPNCTNDPASPRRARG